MGSPAKLTFSIDQETGYTLKEFWEPNGGSTYAEEIRENFLPAILDMVLNPESDVIDTEALEGKCLQKAQAKILELAGNS